MLFLAAVAMSVGWGLRGYIGGGPLGAMIPGALVSFVLCTALGRSAADTARIAAFGAVGIGLGGEMTYGQTVGFLSNTQTFWWGVLGLSVKGAIWGLSGGAILGLALDPRRLPFPRLLIAFGALLAGVQIGWMTINQPKLIYFSNRLDRPREEIWAGLLLGAVLFLATLIPSRHGAVALPFALWGALGGGIGFGLGGTLMTLGRSLPVAQSYFDWWKLMEFTFGFLFGLALAWAAQQRRQLLQASSDQQAHKLSPAAALIAGLALAGVTLVLEEGLGLRYSYVVVGAALLLFVDRVPGVAAVVAVLVTLTAAAYDLGEVPAFGQPWLLATLCVALCAFLPLNLTSLLWGALAISWVKSFAQTNFAAWPAPAHMLVQILFTAGAWAVHRMAANVARCAPPTGQAAGRWP